MPLVTISDLTIRFRGPALLQDVDCIIEPGQRIGLLGRNGAGKTTFMRLLSGDVQPDHGSISLHNGKITLLPQDVPQDLHGTVQEIVSTGVTLDPAVHDIESDQWRIDHAVDLILTKMSLDGEARFESMSSGMKRRVLLARAIVDMPDLLLLDEPTNHLDIASIDWLETFLSRWPNAFMFITHDRQFLRKLATRILEIDGGKIFDWSCDYDTFLRRKEESLAAQEKQDALFDKRLAQEEVWIRQGVKARRTRNEGRVRALKELRVQRSDRRSKIGTSNLQIQEGIRSGNLVAHAEHLDFSYGERQILEDFSTTIMRGDRIGIIGPNGVGKTTLLKILLGSLQPESGSIRLGTNLQIAYFDQLRAKLDPEKTVQEDVGDGYETVQVHGVSKHIIGYLQDFLFSPDRARTPIKQLSGGERNRVLLAKLFTKPANVIVMDEPTNDLDAETLEMLEERLVQYAGTLLIVSHDREFLNNVVTSTIVFESDGQIRQYDGGYDDWLRQTKSTVAKGIETGSTQAEKAAIAKPAAKVKLSFKEQSELKKLPEQIETFETKIAAMHAAMAEPNFYKMPATDIAREQKSLADLNTKLETAMARWESLEAKS